MTQLGWYLYHPMMKMLNKNRELYAPFVLLLFPLFFFLLETIFTGYIPPVILIPSPTSTLACSNVASTITALFSILVFHNYLHSKYTSLYQVCKFIFLFDKRKWGGINTTPSVELTIKNPPFLEDFLL